MSALLDLKLLRYLSPSSKQLRQKLSYLRPAARTPIHVPSRKVILTGPWGSVKPRNSSYSSSGSMVSPGSKLSTIWLSASFSSMMARLGLFAGQLHSSVRIRVIYDAPTKTHFCPIQFLDPLEKTTRCRFMACKAFASSTSHRSGLNRSGWG